MPDQRQHSPTALLPPATQAAVEAALIGQNIAYVVEQVAGRWHTTAQARSARGPRTLRFITDRERPRILLLVEDGTRVSPQTEAATALYCALVNTRCQVATLQLSPGAGRVQIRLCLAADLGAVVNGEMLQLHLQTARWVDERWLEGAREVAEGRLPARRAFQESVRWLGRG